MPAPVIPANDPPSLDQAADVLRAGGLVAVPTETVYGLAADATNADAVARIYAAKGRPSHNPLIAHVADRAMAERYGRLGTNARRLAERFWPGPLTLVVPIRNPLTPAVHAGLATVALRYAPGAMDELAGRLGRPLAAPSANRSGRLSPTTAEHVLVGLGERVDLILDGGPCTAGLESTIVEADNLRLLRPGMICESELREAVEGDLRSTGSGSVEAPGMMASHYAPRARLRLDAERAEPGELLLGFGSIAGTLNLSERGDLEEAARKLYAALAELDAGTQCIAVAPIPRHGVGVAINDRLSRAAADRPG